GEGRALGVRRHVDLSSVAREDLDRIKSQDRKIYGEIQKFLRELGKRADLGVPLHGEWEGCQGAHVC
ncbi:MAG: hypothetical protein ACRD0H_20360, partial [Actinomycetes bacterium]